MSKLPKDDQKLVNFIRQYRPEAPPVHEDIKARIEANIMAVVSASPSSEPVRKSQVISFRRRSLWLMPPAIAAGLLIAWGTNRLLTPAPTPATELASLEVFIEDTWDGVVEPDTQDWYLGF